jgi:hypothetical protein
MPEFELTDADRDQLAQIGISPQEALRQLDRLASPPSFLQLARPAIVDDGIVRVPPDDVAELHAIHAQAARECRFTKFVPASGAATRMFRELLFYQEGDGRGATWPDIRQRASQGQPEATVLATLLTEIKRFAFHDVLEAALHQGGAELDALARDGAHVEILDALLGPQGLDYARLPKGLLKFHAYPNGCRTAFEEHLVEAANYVRDAQGICRLHVTVSPEHRPAFDALLDSVRQRFTVRYGARLEVEFSVQKASTDTLAIDLSDRPIRDGAGRLLLRPGGHGALIENLNDLGGDVVFVKNIDNVQPDQRRGATLEWKRTLAGYLVRLQRRVFEYVNRVRRPYAPENLLDEIERFSREQLHVERNEAVTGNTPRRERLLDRLDRPLRVCGVVPNTGEPGGGPFWVRQSDGTVDLQIVEGAQIEPGNREQQSILRSSTHFNPVDLVCAVRDVDGRPYDLRRFVDPETAIVTQKSAGGRDLKALERPGLWNGAMAHWNTVFVEVPLETFSPVKTVLDLLRDEHQPG